jgi:hypothetical protein
MTQKLALTTCAAPEGKTVVIEEVEEASTQRTWQQPRRE